MSNDGYLSQIDFLLALNQTSFRLVSSRYLEPAYKKGLLKKSAIEVRKSKKGKDMDYFPRSWVGTIKKDWESSEGILPKPRAKKGSGGAVPYKAKTSQTQLKPIQDRTVHLNIPQEGYEVLIDLFGSKPKIHDFLMGVLKTTYEPLISEHKKIEQQMAEKEEALHREKEQLLNALKERQAKRLPNPSEVLKNYEANKDE